MATARDIINRSLKLIGVLAQGETATADQLTDGLDALNDMLDSWSTQNLMIYQYTDEELTLAPSQSVYTMGSGGDLDTTRPIEIVNMIWRDNTDGLDLPIKIVPQAQYKYEPNKDTENSVISTCYVNYKHPLVELTFWPVPSTAEKVEITSYKPLTTYSALSTTVDLPPGYLKALRFNLAIELAPEYGIEPSPYVDREASRARANIKRQNKKPIRSRSEVALLDTNRSGVFDYRTGE